MRCLIAVLAFLLTSPLIGPASAQKAAGGRTARQAWEYQELDRYAVEKQAIKGAKIPFISGLDKLGAAGWEAIAVEPGLAHGVPRYLFKRPKDQQGEVKEGKAAEVVPVQVVRLKHARATETAKILMAAFDGDGTIRVIADDRTNCLLISGSLEKKVAVQKVIDELESIGSEPLAPKKK